MSLPATNKQTKNQIYIICFWEYRLKNRDESRAEMWVFEYWAESKRNGEIWEFEYRLKCNWRKDIQTYWVYLIQIRGDNLMISQDDLDVCYEKKGREIEIEFETTLSLKFFI